MGSINILKQLSTFLKALPLINLNNINSFVRLKKVWECLESNLGQLGPEAIMLTIVQFKWVYCNILFRSLLESKLKIWFFFFKMDLLLIVSKLLSRDWNELKKRVVERTHCFGVTGVENGKKNRLKKRK